MKDILHGVIAWIAWVLLMLFIIGCLLAITPVMLLLYFLEYLDKKYRTKKE